MAVRERHNPFAASERTPLKRLQILIPVLTLIGCVVGWIAERIDKKDEQDWQVHAQSSVGIAPLPPIARDHAIDGRVVSSTGAPVPDAMVWLRSGEEPHWTYTDGEGRFHLDGLAAGPWPASVVARGFAPIKTEIAADQLSVDIKLGAPAAPIPSFAPIRRTTLRGKLSSPFEGDLAGYEVMLSPVDDVASEAPRAASRMPRRVTAIAGGAFTFDELDHGTYTVEVLPPWARGGSWPDLLRPLASATKLSIVHDDTTAAAELALALTAGEVEGVLTSREGVALEGALVLIQPAEDASRVWPPVSSDAEGQFRAGDLPPGNYRIAVRAGAASAETTVELVNGRARSVEFAPLNVRE